MKTLFWLLFGLFMLVYSSNPKITFKPFSVEFESPYTPFALFFLIISLSLFQIQSERKGKLESLEKYYRMGFKEGSTETVKQINEKLKERGESASISISHDAE